MFQNSVFSQYSIMNEKKMEHPALHIQTLRLICCYSIFSNSFSIETSSDALEACFVIFFIPGSSCFLYKFSSDSFNEIPLTIELISPSAPPFLIFTASLSFLFALLLSVWRKCF